MTTTQHKPAAQKEARRRRRKNKGEVIGRRLGVNKSSLDFKKFAYRWTNDDPARIMAKTKEDDWDIVMDTIDGAVKEDSADLGAAVTQIVGTFPNGEAKLAYLCRKPIKFYEEDQADKQAELDKQLQELRRGADRGGKAQADYVPHSGIKVA